MIALPTILLGTPEVYEVGNMTLWEKVFMQMLALEENFSLATRLCNVLKYLALILLSLATTQGPRESIESKDVYDML